MDTHMLPVARLGDLPKNCHIAQFFGKHIDEAVANAEKSGLQCISYFEQKAYGKSRYRTILVEYKKEIGDGESNS